MPSDSALAGHYGTMDAAAVDLNGDNFTDVYLSNGGLDFSRFEPDAVLLNHGGNYFTCEYIGCTPPKSLSVSVCNTSSETPLLFVTKGGLLPGETGQGIIYTPDRE
jgi:hypothetical protein